MKARVLLTMVVVMAVSMVASADTLNLRDGWDPVNNVADAGGYAGTRDDTGTHSDYGATTWTGSDKLIAYRPGAASVVGFDVAAYAGDIATLNSATLVMTFSSAPWWGQTATWAIRNPDKQWVEDEAYYYKASAAAGLWNNWTTGMAMTTPNITTTTVPAGPNTATGRTGFTVDFDVTSLVQTWLDDSANNLGVALVPTVGSSNTCYWAGKAYSTVEYRPMLVLDYVAVPEPATMALMGLGALGLLRRRK